MRVLVVHSRYRSAMPSGENRVVDQESEELARAGHEVRRFEKNSDEIEHWSAVQKALLPARVVWSRESHRELAATLRGYRPTSSTCTTRSRWSAQLCCTLAGTRRCRW